MCYFGKPSELEVKNGVNYRIPEGLAFWRPVEPNFVFRSKKSTIFRFFPLFLAPSEISANFLSKFWDSIISHLQLRGFVKKPLSGLSVVPFVRYSNFTPKAGVTVHLRTLTLKCSLSPIYRSCLWKYSISDSSHLENSFRNVIVHTDTPVKLCF